MLRCLAFSNEALDAVRGSVFQDATVQKGEQRP
jgi:hypothetical protein